ncbi:MAG: thiamine ABC transporter substrate binding subunit [Rhodoluna sp.]
MKRIIALALLALTLTGCTAQTKDLTLVTHDSFVMSDELVKQFEKSSGYNLKVVKAGDVGAMTTKLVLTKDSPIGDVVYGIDNTFSPVAIKNEIIEGDFKAIDYADVCFNVDINYFEENSLEIPKHWKDLVLPKYKNLTVIENPNTSSPGLAFLSSTHGYFNAQDVNAWWKKLRDNGVKVAASWEDAYYTDFSGSAGKGKYPIVLSYSSSPAYEVDENGKPKTKALLDDCFRQTEYAAVLKNSKNSSGAQALIQFLLGEDFQKSLPESMYVYPINSAVKLPMHGRTTQHRQNLPLALIWISLQIEIPG